MPAFWFAIDPKSQKHRTINHMNTASIFKKMAAIVAIVGAGLLAAPLEKAEAQVLSPSHITGVTLKFSKPSRPNPVGIVSISVHIDVFDTGAIVDPTDTYDVNSYWPWYQWKPITNFGDSSTRTEESPPFFELLPIGDCYYVKFFRADNPDDCIKVKICVRSSRSVSATGYDSDGNSYSVDVTVEQL